MSPKDKSLAYLQNSKAANTRKSYESDWKSFVSFCTAHSLPSLPSDESTVVAYLTELAEHHAVSTVSRHMVSIGQAHVSKGYPDVTKTADIHELMKGIRRSKSEEQRKAKPLLLSDVKTICDTLDNSLVSLRNKAILLLGFSTGCRRSELAALRYADLEFVSEGLLVHIRKSKTDQESKGMTKAIPYGTTLCPVLAVKRWLESSGITRGNVFRSIDRFGRLGKGITGSSIGELVKELAKNAGLHGNYSGHSLRSGLITECATQGMQEYEIMAQTGHKSAGVLRGYMRKENLFKSNVVSKINM